MKMLICICLVGLIIFGGCALGSASAGYSLRAKTAEELSPEATERIVRQIKEELKPWIREEIAKSIETK
jgi:hypothetical protein